MRKLIVVTVLLAALIVGDLLATSAASSALESAISSRVGGVGAVDADIRSFPFTLRLLAAGEVSMLDLRLTEVVGRGIDVAWLRLEMEGLRFDRSVAFGGEVRIIDVGQVVVTANITEAAVREATGADVRLLDGRATLTAGGVTTDAAVTVTGGRILLAVDGVPPASVPLPGNELLPCAVDARVVAGALLAECTADRLPQIVLDAVGSDDLRGEVLAATRRRRCC